MVLLPFTFPGPGQDKTSSKEKAAVDCKPEATQQASPSRLEMLPLEEEEESKASVEVGKEPCEGSGKCLEIGGSTVYSRRIERRKLSPSL